KANVAPVPATSFKADRRLVAKRPVIDLAPWVGSSGSRMMMFERIAGLAGRQGGGKRLRAQEVFMDCLQFLHLATRFRRVYGLRWHLQHPQREAFMTDSSGATTAYDIAGLINELGDIPVVTEVGA